MADSRIESARITANHQERDASPAAYLPARCREALSPDSSNASNARTGHSHDGWRTIATMKRRAKWLVVILGGIFIAIQFIGPARTNPPVAPSHTIGSQLQIPPRMADIMNRACMDCHSYETRWPWYSGVAPVRWWLVQHVNDGRETLNLSEWSQYQPAYAGA